MQKPIRNDLFTKLAPLAVILLLWQPAPTVAVEPAERFVDGLRERQLYDLVIVYLDRMKESPLVSDAYKERIPYEQGITLIQHATVLANSKERSEKLQQAKFLLEAYIEANPTSELGLQACIELAKAQVGHGRVLRETAEQLPDTQGDARSERLLEARKFIDLGRKKLLDTKTAYRTKLDAIPKDQPDLAEQRQTAGLHWLTVSLLTHQAAYEELLTYPPENSNRKKLAEQTVQELAHLYDVYESRPVVSLEAHLLEGQFHQALGKLDKAIECYEDIIVEDDSQPWLRRLISKAVRHQAECYLQLKNYDAIIKTGTDWLDRARGNEARESDWLAIRYLLANAHLAKAESVEEKADKKKHINEARDLFKYVSRQRNDYWKESRERYAELSRNSQAATRIQVNNFEEAFQLAKDAFEKMASNRAALDAARQNAPDQVATLEETIEKNHADAWHYLLRAMEMVTEETDPDAVNQARFFQCYLYYTDGDYWRAAVLGEFLTKRYPDHPTARNAAKIAIAAYQQLYTQGRAMGQSDEQLLFEAGQVAHIADLIARRWPNTPDAVAAYTNLINFALQQHRFEDAKADLLKIPEDLRGLSELKIGCVLWADYLTESRRDEAAQSDPDQLAKQRADAIELLEQGFAKIDPDQIDTTVANAGLFLAQAYVADTHYTEAIDILEKPTIGPLALLAAKDPAALRAGFDTEVYRTALQAYALVSPPDTTKSENMMDVLDAALGNGDPESASNLTRIYVGLGIQLQKHLENLPAESNHDMARQISDAYLNILQRIEDQSTTMDWSMRCWVGSAYYHLAEELRANTDTIEPDIQAYYEKARHAYESLLEQAAADDSFAPSAESILGVRKDLADCLSRLGLYREAMDQFRTVLAEKPMLLDMQRDAAYTLQAWGNEDPSKYLKAMGGDYRSKEGKNIVWGWARLANMARRVAAQYPEYEDFYYEGWLNCAQARYLYALKQTGAERKQQLAKSESIVRTLHTVRADLGGSVWREKFDNLLKTVQKAQGEKATGLRGLGQE